MIILPHYAQNKRMSADFIRDRHPHLRMGPRTVVSDLLAIAVASQRMRTLHPGDMIIGPLEADGEYAYVRCSGTVYKCHVDELVAYSRPSVLEAQ